MEIPSVPNSVEPLFVYLLILGEFDQLQQRVPAWAGLLCFRGIISWTEDRYD